MKVRHRPRQNDPIRRARPPIATLRGELDIAIAPALRERLLSLARPGTIRLVVALAAASYVDAPRLTAIETPAEEVTLTSITALSPDRESCGAVFTPHRRTCPTAVARWCSVGKMAAGYAAKALAGAAGPARDRPNTRAGSLVKGTYDS